MREGIKIALIGNGHIGDIYLDELSKLDNVEVVCGVDSKPARVNWFIPVYPTIAHIKRYHPDVDGVAILTPPQSHLEVLNHLSLYGFKNILVEKPPVVNQSQLDSLRKYYAKRVSLFTAWHAQYAKWVNELQQILKNRTVTFFDVKYIEDVRMFRHNFTINEEVGGVADSLINALSIVTHALRQELWIEFANLSYYPGTTVDIGSDIRYKWKNNGKWYSGYSSQQWLSDTQHITRKISFQTDYDEEWTLDIHNSKLYLNGEVYQGIEDHLPLQSEYGRLCADWVEHLRNGESYAYFEPLRTVFKIWKKAEILKEEVRYATV